MKVLFLYRFLTITVIVDCLGLCYNECYQWAVLLYHKSKKEVNMGDFFNVDNKFFQGLGKIIDVICLSAFWFFLCIPIVTAGAATTALYYTVNKVIRNNRSYIGREFWHAFKTNFRQSTIVWLISHYFTSATVSLAIASSSFVGITQTFTLESGVEITASSP